MNIEARGHLVASDDLELVLGGLPPNAAVSLRASLVTADGLGWRSEAEFRADEAGQLSVATSPARSGSYRGADPNGLLWSLAPDDVSLAEQSSLTAGLPTLPVRIEAVVRGDVVASIVVTVELLPHDVSALAVEEDGFRGTLFLPGGAGRFRPVLVLGGSGGDANEPVAALLSRHGYLALALPYFSQPGLPEELVDIDLEYFARALDWLRRHPEAAGPAAVVGRSRGGELSLLLGLELGIELVVAFVPSGVVHAGIRKASGGWMSDVPSWRRGGVPVPYLSHERAELPVIDGVTSCGPVYVRDLGDFDAVERAAIPLERSRSDVLLISGTDDLMWPSSLFSELALARLRARRGETHERHLALGGAGHRFFSPVVPNTVSVVRHTQTGERLALGGDAKANARAGRLSTRAMLRVLEGEWDWPDDVAKERENGVVT